MHKMKQDEAVSLLTIDPLPTTTSIGLAICESGWRLPLRVIHEYEWLIMLNGSIKFDIEERTWTLLPGEAFLIPPHAPHIAENRGENTARFYYVHFNPSEEVTRISRREVLNRMDCLKDQIKETLSLNPFFHLPQSHQRQVALPAHFELGRYADSLYSLFERALHEREQFETDSQLMIRLLTAQVLVLGSRAAMEGSLEGRLSRDGVVPPILQLALRWIQNDHAKTLSVADLAALLKVSPQYLGRLFVKHFGLSPLQYINRMKLDKAKKLMRETTLSIQEISQANGFENPFYFSRLFHRLERESPTAYRKRLAIRGN